MVEMGIVGQSRGGLPEVVDNDPPEKLIDYLLLFVIPQYLKCLKSRTATAKQVVLDPGIITKLHRNHQGDEDASGNSEGFLGAKIFSKQCIEVIGKHQAALAISTTKTLDCLWLTLGSQSSMLFRDIQSYYMFAALMLIPAKYCCKRTEG